MDYIWYAGLNPIVGRILKKADTTRNNLEKFNYLYYSIEATIKYLSVILIVYYKKKDFINETIEKELQKLRKPAIGVFNSIIKKMYKDYSKEKDFPIDTEIFKRKKAENEEWQKVVQMYQAIAEEYGGERKTSISVMDVFSSFITLRNKVIGHGASSEKEAKGWLDRGMEDVVVAVLNKVKDLKKYRLYYLSEKSERAEGLIGKFGELWLSPDDTKPRDIELTDREFGVDELYLYNKEAGEFISIHPLIILLNDRIFILNESGNKSMYLNYVESEQEDIKKIAGDLKKFLGEKDYTAYEGKVFKVKSKPIVIISGNIGTEIEFGNIAREEYGDNKRNDINFRFPDISRRHFRLEIRNNGLRGEDLGSKFGVVYDGLRQDYKEDSDNSFKIENKKSFRLGRYIEFSVFEDERGNYILRYIEPQEFVLLMLEEDQKKLLPEKNTIIIILKDQINLSNYGVEAVLSRVPDGLAVVRGEIEFEDIDNIIL